MTGIRFSPRPNRAHEIHWQEWGEDAFLMARDKDKPVLLSISAVWCHWCHVMDETSYSAPGVIGLINELFVPIRVDNDQRPDINARYNMGGWPTTAFLTPQGDVISGGTYMPPDGLREALSGVSAAYREQKDTLMRRADEVRSGARQKAEQFPNGPDLDAAIVDQVSQEVASAYDSEHGGFGSQPKFPMPSSLELLLHMYRVTGEASYRVMVETTLDNMRSGGLYDHEEGGFFRYSTTGDWSVPHYEKMLEDNVSLLRLYVDAHLATGNQAYADVASGIVGYLGSHIYDPASGAFYGSQDASQEYYSLPLEERRAGEAPVVDPTFYTGMNARAASAYLAASVALSDRRLEDLALGVLDYLIKRRREGPLCHSYSPRQAKGIPALLGDQAHLALALLDGYHQTYQTRYLDEARSVAGDMRSIFGDSEHGGFFDIPDDPHALGNLRVRGKPLVDNGPAAGAFTELFNTTLKEEYRETAETTLRAFVSGYHGHQEAAAGYALAVHRFLFPPVEVVVVGRPGHPGTRSMLTAASTIPYPHTAVKLLDAADDERVSAAGYWPGDEAQAYVCLKTVCLPPVRDPAALHETVAEFLDSGTPGMGAIQTLGDIPFLDLQLER